VPQVPNIQSFDIKLGSISPLLLMNGILGRERPVITMTRGRNKRLNRYLCYMTSRLVLLQLHGKHELFWKVAFWYLNNSNALLLASLHGIDKNLYRTLTTRELVHLLKKVDTLRGKKAQTNISVKMDYHRTYIPKGDTYRPLGVPSLEWRIYSRMLLGFLTIACPLNSTQHGFIPHRGTLTAWKTILLKVIKSPNIYEIDLKQCFPSINLVRLETDLINRFHFPYAVARFFVSLNYSIPSLPKDQKLDESQFNSLSLASKAGLASDQVDYPTVSKKAWFLELPWPSIEATAKVKVNLPGRNLAPGARRQIPEYAGRLPSYETGIPGDIMETFIRSFEPMGKRWDRLVVSTAVNLDKQHYHLEPEDRPKTIRLTANNIEILKWLGTAQGGPLSPFLAAIVIDGIDDLLPKGVEVIKYADDMIFYGKNLPEFINNGGLSKVLTHQGLTLHPEKSGWVRVAFTWHKPLKFLGLVFDGSLQTLTSQTRKGAKLLYDKAAMLNNYFDAEAIATRSRDWFIKRYLHSLRMGIRYVSFNIMGITIPDIPLVVDALQYNLSHYYREMLKYQMESGGDKFLVYVIFFWRMLFELPGNILRSLDLKRLMTFHDKDAAREFIKAVFDKQGKIKISLASDHIIPNKEGPFLIFQKNAPYTEPDGISPTLGHIDPNWFSKVILPGKYVYERIIQVLSLDGGSRLVQHEVNDSVVRSNTPTDITTAPVSFSDYFTWFNSRTEFFTEFNNKYLNSFRNRFTFENLVKSELAGLILSRMYTGRWDLGDIAQDFSFKHHPASLAAMLLRKYKSITLFTGSSLAIHEMSLILSRVTKIKPKIKFDISKSSEEARTTSPWDSGSFYV
jgi:hypothetical protein